MAAEEPPVWYEELTDIELDFENAEVEIIRQQVALTLPIYTRRSATISKIPGFWPLVLEQAPPDIDQYIQPSDSSLLLSSLTSLSVSHFEIDVDPRSIAITLEFAPNDFFENTKLEKKFWFRKAKDGWSGLVSEPVDIKWKKGNDLTGGLLGMVCKAWERRGANGEVKEEKELRKKIENTGMGGLSFFAWFGFIGRRISAEESKETAKLDNAKKAARSTGKPLPSAAENGEAEDDDNAQMELEAALEIFPDGDDLAVAFSEDLWPGAIRYFTQAQEQDTLSDADFESGDEEETMKALAEMDSEDEGPPSKKQRAK